VCGSTGNKLLVPGGFTEYNYYRARKEIVHSFRYLLFAAQLVKTGRIDDYGAANHHLADILREKRENEEMKQRKSNQPLEAADDRDGERAVAVPASPVDEQQQPAAAEKRWRGSRRNDESSEESRRWASVMTRFKPLFEQLRQELKDLREYARLYSRCETEKMLFTSLKDRRKDQLGADGSNGTSVSTSGGEPVESPLATVQFLRHFAGNAASRL
jgi:hypothetical protein